MRIVSRARQLRYNYQAKLGRHVPVHEVATAIGLSRERLTQIELGRLKEIDIATLAKLCKFYGVNVADIFEFREEEIDAKTPATPRK